MAFLMILAAEALTWLKLPRMRRTAFGEFLTNRPQSADVCNRTRKQPRNDRHADMRERYGVTPLKKFRVKQPLCTKCTFFFATRETARAFYQRADIYRFPKVKFMSARRWLSRPTGLTGQALLIWKRLAFRAYAKGLLTPETAERFRGMCRALALADKAWDEIEQNGAVVRSASGAVRQNPAIRVMFEAQREAAKAAEALHLNDDLDGFAFR